MKAAHSQRRSGRVANGVEARAAALLALLLTASGIPAQSGPPMPDRFTATTASMTPRDVTVRIDVREWSDEAGRAAAVAALDSGADAPKALAELPTIGYVWQSGSAVGYSLKYAHRAPAEHGERVTFVTDKRLGAYEIKPWTADEPASQDELGYSVIELYLDADGKGAGTLSLAADLQLDAAGGLVVLAPDAPRVLANAKAEPKPYWATQR